MRVDLTKVSRCYSFDAPTPAIATLTTVRWVWLVERLKAEASHKFPDNTQPH